MITFQKLIPGRMCYTLHKYMPTPKQISQRWIKSLVLVKERERERANWCFLCLVIEESISLMVICRKYDFPRACNYGKHYKSPGGCLRRSSWWWHGLQQKGKIMNPFMKMFNTHRKWSSSMVTMSDHITFKRKKMQCIYRQQQEITDHVPSAHGRRVWVSIFEWSSGEAMPQLSFD